jgi:hypothetical protein
MNGIEHYLHLVVNRENNLIYSMCNNSSIANAVSKGFINSSVMVIPYSIFNRPTYIIEYSKKENITCKLLHQLNYGSTTLESNLGEKVYQTPSKTLFDVLPVEFIEDELWIETRKIANLRTTILSNLEHRLKRYLARYKEYFYDEVFYNFLSKNLNLCSPENNLFVTPILEYADIVGLSPKEAFYDLKSKHDSFELCIFRHSALWQKYVDKVNCLTEDNKQIYFNFESELSGMNR